MTKAYEIEPTNDSIKRQLAVIRSKIAEHNRKEKVRFAGLFDRKQYKEETLIGASQARLEPIKESVGWPGVMGHGK